MSGHVGFHSHMYSTASVRKQFGSRSFDPEVEVEFLCTRSIQKCLWRWRVELVSLFNFVHALMLCLQHRWAPCFYIATAEFTACGCCQLMALCLARAQRQARMQDVNAAPNATFLRQYVFAGLAPSPCMQVCQRMSAESSTWKSFWHLALPGPSRRRFAVLRNAASG